jgi:hypothetical protein
VKARATSLACLAAAALWSCSGDGGGEDAGLDSEPDASEEEEPDAVADALDDAPGEPDAEVDVEEEPDPEWEAFLAARPAYLRDLGAPILTCVERDDTTNPCFHGCIDWHSAVEGTWALLALSRVLEDPSLLDAANAILEPSAVADELAQLESGGPVPTEIPYGYSWFLVLAREREMQGAADLTPLAELVAPALETYLMGLTRGEIDGTMVADDYQNLSWIVVNLWQWADWTVDVDLADWLVSFTRNEIVPREFFCPLSSSPTRIHDFFPPCLHRAWLITTVLPPDEVAAWIETGVPAELDLEPLGAPPDAHTAGLNFSRCFGLWSLWDATGERRFRDMYMHHIVTHMAMPEYWRDDYLAHAHWIPQFGTFAILRSYE